MAKAIDPAVIAAVKQELADGQTANTSASSQGITLDSTKVVRDNASGDTPLSPSIAKYVTKENGELILRFPEVTKEDGTILKTETVYKAKTEEELMQALIKGVTEKDATIKRLSEERPKKSPLRGLTSRQPQVDDDPAMTAPNLENIRTEVAQELLSKTGLDPKFLKFGDNEWDEFERENTSWRTNEARQKVKEFVNSFNTEVSSRFNAATADAATSVILANEADQIESLLGEYGISVTDDEFSALVEEVLADKANYDISGTLKSGVVVGKFIRKIKSQLTPAQKTDVVKKIEDAVNDANAAADRVNGAFKSQKGGGGVDTQTNKGPKTLKQAQKNILADIASGKLLDR